MSDGKIIYDVDINDDGIESKLNSTNNKIKNGSESGSKASEDIWTGALRRSLPRTTARRSRAVSMAT